MHIKSSHYRIIEYPKLEGTHKDHWVQPLAPHSTTQTQCQSSAQHSLSYSTWGCACCPVGHSCALTTTCPPLTQLPSTVPSGSVAITRELSPQMLNSVIKGNCVKWGFLYTLSWGAFLIIPRIILRILPVTKAGRPVITSILWFALVDWDNLCQLQVDWDLSRFPRLWKNNWERSHGGISQLFEHHGINPTRSHRWDLWASCWGSKKCWSLPGPHHTYSPSHRGSSTGLT